MSVLRPAHPGDLRDVLTLLEEEGLPTAEVAKWLHRFVVARDGHGLAGVAGLEIHGTDAVLRSVAVAPRQRGDGLGAALTEEVLRRAAEEGIRRVYLLTTTAADYFTRHGFQPIAREEASETVRASVEFGEACPASATAMVRALDGPERG